MYLITLILQQGLQLLAQHQGAEVRYRHRLGVWPLRTHSILTKTQTGYFHCILWHPLLSVGVLRRTDRHLLQAAGQAGGGDAVARPLRVVQALQRTTHTVAACQQRPAAFLLLTRRLALQKAQGVRLHRLRDQTET